MEGHVVAEAAVAADDRAAVQAAAGAEHAALADHGEGRMLASGPIWAVGWTKARGSMPWTGGSGWPCSFCTMATKADRASFT